MASAFAQLCEERSVLPDVWRKQLSTPIIPEKCLLDMTEDELMDHYMRVQERADTTKKDRALAVLETTENGRLESQARTVFAQESRSGGIAAEEVPEMLERLQFELTNTEVHFLLQKFGATDGCDMIPDKKFNESTWLWLVGECQMLKDLYRHMNPQAFEVCYESSVQNLKSQKEAGLAGTDEWPHIKPTGPGWFMNGGVKPGYEGPLKPYVWGLAPEAEEALIKQLAREDAEAEAKAGHPSASSIASEHLGTYNSYSEGE